MKKFKDRTIRKSNIPKDKVIFQVISRFRYKFIVLLILFIIMIIIKPNVYMLFILLLAYILMSINDEVIFEVRESFFLKIIDEDFAEIIYYSDMLNYQIKVLDKKMFDLIIYTNEEEEYIYTLDDFNVITSIDKIIGEKRVGK